MGGDKGSVGGRVGGWEGEWMGGWDEGGGGSGVLMLGDIQGIHSTRTCKEVYIPLRRHLDGDMHMHTSKAGMHIRHTYKAYI